MSKEEMLQENNLIAEFMGNKIVYDGISHHFYYKNSDGISRVKQTRNLYNSSWDWLMPVVDKIEENYYTEILGTNTKNDNSYVMNIFDYNGKFIFDPHSHKSKLELVFITIVDFIKWYNQNKKV